MEYKTDGRLAKGEMLGTGVGVKPTKTQLMRLVSTSALSPAL